MKKKNRLPLLFINQIFNNIIEVNARELNEILKGAKIGAVPQFEAKFELDLTMYQKNLLSKEEEKRFYL